jgi:hypothetical protein
MAKGGAILYGLLWMIYKLGLQAVETNSLLLPLLLKHMVETLPSVLQTYTINKGTAVKWVMEGLSVQTVAGDGNCLFRSVNYMCIQGTLLLTATVTRWNFNGRYANVIYFFLQWIWYLGLQQELPMYSYPDIIRQVKSRRMRWAGHVARMGEERRVHKILVGKPEGKWPLGRPRRRWEHGIRMDLRETGFWGVDWIRLAQDRDRWRAVVSAVMNFRVLAPRS